MRNLLVFVGVLLICLNANGQDMVGNELLPDLEWGSGSVILNDGTELKGMIKYNDKEGGLVSYDQGSESHSFGPRLIMGFEFFDEKVQRQRTFYTIEYAGEGPKKPSFFELLKDFGEFAIVSKIDPIEIEIKNHSYAGGYGLSNNYAGKSVRVSQVETVFVLTKSEEIKPYLQVTRKVVERIERLKDKYKQKIIDKKVLKEYFPEPWSSKMNDFANEDNLDSGTKEDYVKLLEYYASIRPKN
jgi:hypothetical protein